MIQHFLDQFVNRYFAHPEFHRAVYLSLLGYWIIVLIRNPVTAWMLGR